MQYSRKGEVNEFFHRINWEKSMVYIIFVAVFIIFSLTLGDRGFLSSTNLLNVMRQTAMISIMSVAGTFVLASGQIDLSVGSVAAMTAMIVALTIQSTNSIFLALLLGLIFGLIVGIINGLLVTKLKIPAFLTTLGTMQMIRGSAMWITDTAAVPITNKTYNTVFGIGSIAGVPVLIIWTIVFFIVGTYVFNTTIFGRHTLATGGNEISAKYSGVNTDRVKLKVFMMSSAFASFAGILYAGRMQAGRYSFGNGDEMSVIASVVLGGAAMSGGTGSVLGTLVGSLLMGIISNALILGGLSSSQQTIVQGFIIVAAVGISNIVQGKNKK